MDSFESSMKPNYKQKKFFCIMNDEHISDEDHLHAQNVWKTFKLKTMGHYNDLYLTSDVLLL